MASRYRSRKQGWVGMLEFILDHLAAEGRLEVAREGDWTRVDWPAGAVRGARLRWALRKPLAKAAYFLQLLKTAFTFGDWLPYVLWKLERHTGVKVEPTEQQLRHPFIYGWPVLFRLLRERALR